MSESINHPVCEHCAGTGHIEEAWAPAGLANIGRITFEVVCPDCGGLGYPNDEDRCETCGVVLGVDSVCHEMLDGYVCTSCFSGAVDDAHERYKDSLYGD